MNTETSDPDCFALPPGVNWLPVGDAISRILSSFNPLDKSEVITLDKAVGRILAKQVTALRANPPLTNSAVDGFAFAFDSLTRHDELELASGYAAPGSILDKPLPFGKAIKILTGAPLPEGVDTVHLQEYSQIDSNRLHFKSRPKKGANTRLAGEDIKVGDQLFDKGHKIRTNDLASLVSSGVDKINVYAKLRVGVLSTGNELCESGMMMDNATVFDANRPMLLSLIQKMGFVPVDLGMVGDNRDDVRNSLNRGASCSDIILTSGGASSGMEDFVSDLLSREGRLNFWRIAVKPGRPLALSRWQDAYIFGLPGNPIAAFVCSLVFAHPAMCILSGELWRPPVGFMVPAAFEKHKKAGRREYLRARMNDEGLAEIFPSEGSGLTTSLSWSAGLVELGEDTLSVDRGSLIKYYPYSSFWV
ncbi:MAG: molybdopterin-binding protein [Rhodobacteraceae bacterium]|nr:molybdopterin-binding protein [Paracoccaceae bacterium]MCY4251557.1 molybdopterin-binding protein [Paracoccaceae bacterium]